ncbi:MAG TPA: phosphatase PAP2 family protein [Pseudomonadales bacterium]|nr:phosphatase PAP2 family protein [Pseudomonadales bacterium]
MTRKEFGYLLLWLLAGALAVALSFSLDGPVDDALKVHSHLQHTYALIFTKFGEGWVPALVGILLVILFVRRHRPGIAAKIFFVILTGELAGVAAIIVRLFAGRTRPSAHVPQGFYGVWHDGHWVIGRYDFSAFPSGHAAMAIGLAAGAWLLHRRWGIALALFAAGVSWSRIAFQSHHFSDVVASVVLAVPLAVIMKKNLLPYLELRFAKFDYPRQKEKRFVPADQPKDKPAPAAYPVPPN